MERFLAACAISMSVWVWGNPAHAQDAPASRPIEFGLMAGGVGVTGQFRGRISSGPSGGVEAQVSLPPHWLALRADLQYLAITNYQTPCGGRPGDCSVDGNATRVVSGGVGVVARLNAPDARWTPYVVGGIAMYRVDKSDSGRMTTVRTNPFGWQGGLGIEVRSSKHVFFSEARYMTIAPGGVVPIVVGMRF
jgi:opacity protein-like surface antigen